MDLSSVLNGISIGKDTTGNFRPTLMGLAVRTDDGKFVVREGDGFLEFPAEWVPSGGDGYVFRLPVKLHDVKRHDVIVRSETPMRTMFVEKVDAGSKQIEGLDPASRERITYVPPSNLLLKTELCVKVVSLIDDLPLKGNGSRMLPWLLMTQGAGAASSGDGALSTLLMTQALDGGASEQELLPLLLMSPGSGSDSMQAFLVMQALSGKTLLSGRGGHKTAVAQRSRSSGGQRRRSRKAPKARTNNARRPVRPDARPNSDR